MPRCGDCGERPGTQKRTCETHPKGMLLCGVCWVDWHTAEKRRALGREL